MYVEIREFKFGESDHHITKMALKLVGRDRKKKTLKISINNYSYFIRQHINRRDILIISIPSTDIHDIDTAALFSIGFIKTPMGEFRYHIETWKTDEVGLTDFIKNLLHHIYGATDSSILNLQLNEEYTPLPTKIITVAIGIFFIFIPFVSVYFKMEPFYYIYSLFGGSRSPFLSGFVLFMISIFAAVTLYALGYYIIKNIIRKRSK